MNTTSSFQGLNFGTKPSTTDLEEIKIKIDPELMLNDFAKAYVGEMTRRNPGRFKAVNLSVEELHNYFKQLIKLRIDSISPAGTPLWRQAKLLLIPTWIQFSLSCIGEFINRDYGFKIVPIMDDVDVDIESMLVTSDKLAAFIPDGLGLHRDAMPRGKDGDFDVMSFAIIGSMVKGMRKDQLPLASYVAAFLGFKLMEESSYKLLYRVNYDDAEFIRTCLMHEEKLY